MIKLKERKNKRAPTHKRINAGGKGLFLNNIYKYLATNGMIRPLPKALGLTLKIGGA